MADVEARSMITCDRPTFDALPKDQQFALLAAASQNSTHLIRYVKKKGVWVLTFELAVESWEPRSHGMGRVRHPKRFETGTLAELLEKGVEWMLSTEQAKSVFWVDNQGAGI